MATPAIAVVVGAFNPDQPRDKAGRWGHGGSVATTVNRGLARFKAHGGFAYARPLKAAQVSNYARRLTEQRAQLTQAADRDRWDHDLGVRFTGFALDGKSHIPGTQVHIALDDHGWIAGAVAYYERHEEGESFMVVDHLGTTGTAAGAGTALAHAVAKVAAAKGLGVMGEPFDDGAQAFWEKLGWHQDPLDLGATTFWGWTPAEAAEVVRRG